MPDNIDQGIAQNQMDNQQKRPVSRPGLLPVIAAAIKGTPKERKPNKYINLVKQANPTLSCGTVAAAPAASAQPAMPTAAPAKVPNVSTKSPSLTSATTNRLAGQPAMEQSTTASPVADMSTKSAYARLLKLAETVHAPMPDDPADIRPPAPLISPGYLKPVWDGVKWFFNESPQTTYNKLMANKGRVVPKDDPAGDRTAIGYTGPAYSKTDKELPLAALYKYYNITPPRSVVDIAKQHVAGLDPSLTDQDIVNNAADPWRLLPGSSAWDKIPYDKMDDVGYYKSNAGRQLGNMWNHLAHGWGAQLESAITNPIFNARMNSCLSRIRNLPPGSPAHHMAVVEYVDMKNRVNNGYVDYAMSHQDRDVAGDYYHQNQMDTNADYHVRPSQTQKLIEVGEALKKNNKPETPEYAEGTRMLDEAAKSMQDNPESVLNVYPPERRGAAFKSIVHNTLRGGLETAPQFLGGMGVARLGMLPKIQKLSPFLGKTLRVGGELGSMIPAGVLFSHMTQGPFSAYNTMYGNEDELDAAPAGPATLQDPLTRKPVQVNTWQYKDGPLVTDYDAHRAGDDRIWKQDTKGKWYKSLDTHTLEALSSGGDPGYKNVPPASANQIVPGVTPAYQANYLRNTPTNQIESDALYARIPTYAQAFIKNQNRKFTPEQEYVVEGAANRNISRARMGTSIGDMAGMQNGYENLYSYTNPLGVRLSKSNWPVAGNADFPGTGLQQRYKTITNNTLDNPAYAAAYEKALKLQQKLHPISTDSAVPGVVSSVPKP